MIYPINQMIEELLNQAVDEETGELRYTEEEMEHKIEELQISFDEKVDSLCNAAKNAKAEAADIKDEKMRLAKRQSSAEKSYERARNYIGFLLQGEKYKNARHNVYYMQTPPSLVVDDNAELIGWLKMNAPGLLNEPTLRTADIVSAMKNGMQIPFAHLEQDKVVVVR